MAWVYYAWVAGMALTAWLERDAMMGFPRLSSMPEKYRKLKDFLSSRRDGRAAVDALPSVVDDLGRDLVAAGERVEYVIQPGDTLTKIAHIFGSSIGAIQAANSAQIPDVNKIRAGAKIVIPR
jgi:hypothetical protein